MCSGSKHVKEHVASLLPFKVIESTAGKSLRIGEIALAAGMSRNFNVYTPEELAVFAEKRYFGPLEVESLGAAITKKFKLVFKSQTSYTRS